jgi:acetylornithine deacetylase/succinyl-diaminopimelate desuccinylase-like protein
MHFRALIVFAAIAVSGAVQAQSSLRAALAASQWRNAHQTEILQQFTTLLSIPNVASDRENIRRNADLLKSMLQKRGVDSRLLTVEGVNPVVFGEIKTPSAKDTIVFYAHYDGQPVTPSEWEGNAPFTPVIRKVNGEDRIFARSASDDKGAIMAQLAALDALRAAHIPFRSNIRFIWEGEEEAGSPHLEAILNVNRDLAHGDVWLVCDGPVDQSGQQTVVFCARGDTHLEITVLGAIRGLHSGHYGNWAPNPAMMLAQLLAGMKDPEGNALIPHFYDGISPLSTLGVRPRIAF